ncbi:MAG: cytochrome c biogenesis protein ResB [bacterium]|nr:cytochrome c biogenesis protein ResB [bacterium]
MKKQIIKVLSSLELAITCLSVLFILTVIGTIAQVKLGIFFAVERYFNSWVITWNATPNLALPVFPGALTIGVVLLINLIASHFTRFKLTKDKIGIWCTHFGLILLIIAGGISACSRYESQMALEEGERKNYSENSREMVFDIIDQGQPNQDRLISFPSTFNKKGAFLEHESLPFKVEITDYYPNSKLIKSQNRRTSHGLGEDLSVANIPISTNDNVPNLPAAYITILDTNNEILGTLMLSAETELSQVVPGFETMLIALRPKRVYFPFHIALDDFTHEKYPGTRKPSYFESRITIHNNEGVPELEARIYMNHPLRYSGHTFFQASYDKEDTVSVLQVVKNPSWLLPYIACVFTAIGLGIQFWQGFAKYRRKQKKEVNPNALV